MESRNICKFNFTRSGDLICTDFIYETGNAREKESVAEQYLLGMVTKGEGALIKRGERFALPQGSIFLLQKGECFCIRAVREPEYFYIRFHGRRAQELVERVGASDEQCVFSCEAQEASLVAFALDCLQRASSENLDLFSEAVLLYILAHLTSDRKPQNDLVAAIVTKTNESFSDASFSLAQLSTELGYDAKYLSFLFKKKKGLRFTHYLRDLRIKHAVFLMEQGVVSVKNIAILSGFGDALYFSKIFKECMGQSPKAYMEELQRGDS